MISLPYGKEITYVMVDELIYMEHQRKLIWIPAEGRCVLSARTQIASREWEFGVSDRDMEQVQDWCEEHNCGKRISFDQFRFRNRKEITMFLLRWA